MRVRLTLALAAVALLVAGAAVWRRLSPVEGGGREAGSRSAVMEGGVAAPGGVSVSSAPAPKPPSTPSGSSALDLASRLAKLRSDEEYRRVRGEKLTSEQKVLEESLRNEIEALAEALKKRLEANPHEWPDVLGQLTWVGNQMDLFEITRKLSPLVDESIEPELFKQLKFSPRPNGRRAAIALLVDSPSPAALDAFLEATHRDENSGVRYAAFMELVRRQHVPEFQAKAPLIKETIKRQTEVEKDPGVRRLMTRYLPGNAPPPPPYKPRHKGGKRPAIKVGE